MNWRQLFGLYVGMMVLLTLWFNRNHAQAQPIEVVGGHYLSAEERQAFALERIANALETIARKVGR